MRQSRWWIQWGRIQTSWAPLNPSEGSEEPGHMSLFGNIIDDKYFYEDTITLPVLLQITWNKMQKKGKIPDDMIT